MASRTTVTARWLLSACASHVGVCEHDQQQRDADPVVEAALDVQSLAHADRQARLGHHGLAEGGIGRCEQHGEDQRLGEAQIRQDERRRRAHRPRS